MEKYDKGYLKILSYWKLSIFFLNLFRKLKKKWIVPAREYVSLNWTVILKQKQQQHNNITINKLDIAAATASKALMLT